MQPVAATIARKYGVLEPLLSVCSIEGQLYELHEHVLACGSPPLVICGHSWGAWLGFLYAARYPTYVHRLVLISSGPFEDRYAPAVAQTRLKRLSKDDIRRLTQLQDALDHADDLERNTIFRNIGQLLFPADSHSPYPYDDFSMEYRYDVFAAIWAEAELWRKTGRLLREGKNIRCPVIAIHGDVDPHPAAGVQQPLSKILQDFRFILLQKCGHYPWLERQAQQAFYTTLEDALKDPESMKKRT